MLLLHNWPHDTTTLHLTSTVQGPLPLLLLLLHSCCSYVFNSKHSYSFGCSAIGWLWCNWELLLLLLLQQRCAAKPCETSTNASAVPALLFKKCHWMVYGIRKQTVAVFLSCSAAAACAGIAARCEVMTVSSSASAAASYLCQRK